MLLEFQIAQFDERATRSTIREGSNNVSFLFSLVPISIETTDISSVLQKSEKLACFKSSIYPEPCTMTEIRTKAGGLFVVAGSYADVMSRIKPKTGADACASDVLG